MANSIVITLAIILSWIRRLSRSINSSVVGASEDAIHAILVQDVGVEEHADACVRCWYGVTEVVGALFLAGGGADAGVVRLRCGEGLHAHVGVGVGRCVDCESAEVGGAGPAWNWLW